MCGYTGKWVPDPWLGFGNIDELDPLVLNKFFAS